MSSSVANTFLFSTLTVNFIEGEDVEDNFVASGMDGPLKLNKNILPSNFWNIKILEEKEIFDTQKGIVRKIEVKELGNEEI